nr:lysozyme inhibitor LprI family protein [Inquilinus limosus]
MNRTYDQLMRSLDQASRDKLRAAQRQWLVFRDADMAFQRQEFVAGNGKYGTLAGVTLASDNVETIRRRVMTLRAYLGPD